MALSANADKIRSLLVLDGKIEYWIAVAKKDFVTMKPQYQAGPNYVCDCAGLEKRLKTDLSSKIADVNDDDWNEFAAWLCGFAIPT